MRVEHHWWLHVHGKSRHRSCSRACSMPSPLTCSCSTTSFLALAASASLTASAEMRSLYSVARPSKRSSAATVRSPTRASGGSRDSTPCTGSRGTTRDPGGCAARALATVVAREVARSMDRSCFCGGDEGGTRGVCDEWVQRGGPGSSACAWYAQNHGA